MATSSCRSTLATPSTCASVQRSRFPSRLFSPSRHASLLRSICGCLAKARLSNGYCRSPSPSFCLLQVDLENTIANLVTRLEEQNTTIAALRRQLEAKDKTLAMIKASVGELAGNISAVSSTVDDLPPPLGSAACNPADSCLQLHRAGCHENGVFWVRPYGSNGGTP